MFTPKGTSRHPSRNDLIGWLQSLPDDVEIVLQADTYTRFEIDFCRSPNEEHPKALILLHMERS